MSHTHKPTQKTRGASQTTRIHKDIRAYKHTPMERALGLELFRKA